MTPKKKKLLILGPLGGVGLSAPPVGFFYLIDIDGAFIVDIDGAYIITQ